MSLVFASTESAYNPEKGDSFLKKCGLVMEGTTSGLFFFPGFVFVEEEDFTRLLQSLASILWMGRRALEVLRVANSQFDVEEEDEDEEGLALPSAR